MARPRSVAAKVLDYFVDHAQASLSVTDLMAELHEYRSSQIAHALSSLLASGEIERDGKRRTAFMSDGRTSRIQFYRVNPAVVIQHKEKDAMCLRLGIDAARLQEMPFDVTPALSTFFMIQQALRGGARFESVRAQRYGIQPEQSPDGGHGAPLGQLDLGLGASV